MESPARQFEPPQGVGRRRGRIPRFQFRYRNSGLFSGLDTRLEDADLDVAEGTPQELAHDREVISAPRRDRTARSREERAPR